MKKAFILLCLALVPAIASAQGLDKYIEMLRSDIRTQKTVLLTEALKLTDAQSTKFWPIQREYETELAKVQDARLAMIKDYAASYDTMDDAKATALMNAAFKLQDQRSALLKKYCGKVSKDVSPMVATRFAQVEAFVQSLVDVQVRGEVPLVP
jgi:Spy/CpxP family protein refolding chaperone